jgi:hypothetical protein
MTAEPKARSMRNEKLDAILAAAKPKIAEHWMRVSDLPGHSTAAHEAVDHHIQAYFDRLKALPEPADRDAILQVMRALFVNLDKALEEFGGGLLETDERELLCKPVSDAAEAAGLVLDEFDNRDPTFLYRNF